MKIVKKYPVAAYYFMTFLISWGGKSCGLVFGLPDGEKITLCWFVLMIGLFNGLVEELGCTGFVTPRLKLNQNLISAGIALGIMWGLWHLLSNYLGSASGAGTVPLVLFLPFMLFSFITGKRQHNSMENTNQV